MAHGTFVRPRQVTQIVTTNSNGITVDDVLKFAKTIKSLNPNEYELVNEVTTIINREGKTIQLVAEVDYRSGTEIVGR